MAGKHSRNFAPQTEWRVNLAMTKTPIPKDGIGTKTTIRTPKPPPTTAFEGTRQRHAGASRRDWRYENKKPPNHKGFGG